MGLIEEAEAGKEDQNQEVCIYKQFLPAEVVFLFFNALAVTGVQCVFVKNVSLNMEDKLKAYLFNKQIKLL